MLPLEQINLATLNCFYRAKWKSKPCEICDAVEWSWGKTPEHPCIGIPLVNTSGALDSFYYAAQLLVCTNCGNVKQIFLGTVDKWSKTPEGALAIQAEHQRLLEAGESPT